MNPLNRRDFIKRAAGTLVATAALQTPPAGAEGKAAVGCAASVRCSLGRSGLSCTRLGVGTGTRAWNKDSAQIRRGRDVFIKTLTHAYERGVRYYDLADMYGSHEYLRDAMAGSDMKREEMFVLTKAVSKTGEELRADLERMRRELDMDYIDAVLLHCMTAGDWPERMEECLDVLNEAQEKGIIKAKGVSCHHLHALQTAATSDWVDIILARINPYGTHMDGTREEIVDVLSRAKAHGKGVIGMKILGEGKHVDEKEPCLKFAMGLDCIDAFTIGFLGAEELEEIITLMDRVSVG